MNLEQVYHDNSIKDFILRRISNETNIDLIEYFVISFALLGIHHPGVFFKKLKYVNFTNVYNYFSSAVMEVMYNVHMEYYIILIAILILILTLVSIEMLIFRNIDYRYSIMNSFILELTWSMLPALIILHFMMMSIALLYISDEHHFFGYHAKVIGHQWYWEYEILKCFNNVDSVYTYMIDSVIPENDYSINLQKPLNVATRFLYYTGMYGSGKEGIKYESERLLDTQGVLYVPYRIHVRLLVTSMDVIHSFAIPSLGIKADAIPGRLNDLHFFLTDSVPMTHYFGQCSELCGVGHAFMPVHMVSI